MSRPYDLCDCSRAFLECVADNLEREVVGGREDLRERLEAVRAQIPYAPEYTITHHEERKS